jgi:hypothetical protein
MILLILNIIAMERKRTGCSLALMAKRRKVYFENMENNTILPDEILVHIFSYLESHYLVCINNVCKYWYNIIKTPYLWTNIPLDLSIYPALDLISKIKMVLRHPQFDSITCLSIAPKKISDKSIKNLFTICPRLKNLEIKLDITIYHLYDIVTFSKGTLEGLSVTCLIIPHKCDQTFIIGTIKMLKQLRYLKINKIVGPWQNSFLEQININCQNLISLELFNVPPFNSINNLVPQPSIEYLHLRSMDSGSNITIYCLLKNCPNIKVFRFKGSYVPDIPNISSLKFIEICMEKGTFITNGPIHNQIFVRHGLNNQKKILELHHANCNKVLYFHCGRTNECYYGTNNFVRSLNQNMFVDYIWYKIKTILEREYHKEDPYYLFYKNQQKNPFDKLFRREYYYRDNITNYWKIYMLSFEIESHINNTVHIDIYAIIIEKACKMIKNYDYANDEQISDPQELIDTIISELKSKLLVIN